MQLRKKLAKLAARRHFAALPQGQRRDAQNAAAAPLFLPGKLYLRVVIGPGAGDHGNLMAAFGERRDEIARVLRGGYYVGIEALIQQQYFHDV